MADNDVAAASWRDRVDRLVCRFSGHAWLDHEFWSTGGTEPFSTCVRCGTTAQLPRRGRHRMRTV